MAKVPAKTAKDARTSLERIRDLAEFGLTADRANSGDEREWFRTVMRAFGDIFEESQEARRKLTDEADRRKVLTPLQISQAAHISREIIYQRRRTRK